MCLSYLSILSRSFLCFWFLLLSTPQEGPKEGASPLCRCKVPALSGALLVHSSAVELWVAHGDGSRPASQNLGAVAFVAGPSHGAAVHGDLHAAATDGICEGHAWAIPLTETKPCFKSPHVLLKRRVGIVKRC